MCSQDLFRSFTTTSQSKGGDGQVQNTRAKQASQAPKMRPSAPKAMPKVSPAPPAREIGAMWPWGPSFMARRESSKLIKSNQIDVLFGVGLWGRGIRAPPLIILTIGLPDAPVRVWWVSHVPVMESRGRELAHSKTWVRVTPWGLPRRLNGGSLGY